MQLEKQVCSLAIAKRLKKLKVKQESLWYWRDRILLLEHAIAHAHNGNEIEDNEYSAFTVAELGDMIKDEIYGLPAYSQNSKIWFWNNMKADTEADIRAIMIVYLIENGKLNV